LDFDGAAVGSKPRQRMVWCASCAGVVRLTAVSHLITVELVVLRHPCGPGPTHNRNSSGASGCVSQRESY